MVAARCPDCGAEAEKAGDGTLVIRHTGNDCDQEEPPALVLRELVGMRDILIQRPWKYFQDFFADTQPRVGYLDVHIQSKCVMGGDEFYIEVRGSATNFSAPFEPMTVETERLFGEVTFMVSKGDEFTFEVVVHPVDPADYWDRPINISGLWFDQRAPRIQFDLTETTVHEIHEPSPTAPVVAR